MVLRKPIEHQVVFPIRPIQKLNIRNDFLRKSFRIQYLDVSNCHHEDFGLGNQIFRSEINNSGAQENYHPGLLRDRNLT